MKKLIAILLLVVLSVNLWACQKKDDNSPEQDTSAEQAGAPETNEEEASDEEIDLEAIDTKLKSYRKALNYLEKGNIEDAYDIFLSIKGYRDVNDYLDRFSFKHATEMRHHSLNRSARTNYYEYNEYGKTTLQLSFFSNCPGVDSFVFEYDDNQNLLSEVHYTNGDVDDFLYYTYDENNRPTSQTRSEYGTVNYEYDSHGNIIKASTNNGNVTEYTYDEEGRMLSELSGCNKTVCEYDLQGNCTRIVFTYNAGEADESSTVVTQQYDENGNLIRKQRELSSGYSYYSEYEYDERGNQIRYATYYPENSYVIFSWKYDENGNMTEYHREDEDGQDYSYFYEYDSNGNLIKETYQSYSLDYTSVTTYEYDSYGNLIKKIQPGETNSPDDYYVTIYTGYKLYYNPYGTQILPPDYWAKG